MRAETQENRDIIEKLHQHWPTKNRHHDEERDAENWNDQPSNFTNPSEGGEDERHLVGHVEHVTVEGENAAGDSDVDDALEISEQTEI